MNEVDLIIHHMRQSKMDSVRKELEALQKDAKHDDEDVSAYASILLDRLLEFFKTTSNNAPLP